MSRMIKFEYRGTQRQALEIGPDSRIIGCMYCFQVTPQLGHRSFKVHEMMDVQEISREPFVHALQDIDETGFMGERGGGHGVCQGRREDGDLCLSVGELNSDQLCSGCETAVVLLKG